MDNYDISVPDRNLHNRWLVTVLIGPPPRLRYLNQKSEWGQYVADAKTWATKDEAEMVAGHIILSNPEGYFGKVEVRRLVS